MKKVYQMEIKRAFQGLSYRITLLIGCGISLCHVIRCGIPHYRYLRSLGGVYKGLLHPVSASELWMGGNTYNIEGFVFYAILPLLAVFPYGQSYYEDVKGGFIRQIYSREQRSSYLKAKYLAVFLSGGTAVIIPLLVNWLGTLLFVPNLLAESALQSNNITYESLWKHLFFTKPGIYLGIFLALTFVFAGIYATMALSVSFFSEWKIFVYTFPFFVQMGIYTITMLIGKLEFSNVYFLVPGFGITSVGVLAGHLIIGFCLTALLFYILGKKEDIL